MNLDDIDRWRGGGSRQDHQSSRYASQYSRKWDNAYRSVYEPPPPPRFFKTDLPSPSLPPRRSAPPPPPLPTPPPSHSSGSDNAKRERKHHSKRRRRRRAKSTSFTSSTAASTATNRTLSTSSTDSTTSSTSASSKSSSSTASSSGSTESSDSDRASTTTASSSSSSTSSKSTLGTSTASSRERRTQHRMTAQQHLQQHFKALSRVARRPSTMAQDEEIAAAAACRALLKKEAQLKEKELRLLKQKRSFAAEVQRRSSRPHRFMVEDDAIRQMQRLVDLANTAPALEEYVRHTSKALPASGASTDAGALAYLRSYEGSASGEGVAPLLNRIAAPPPSSTMATANPRSEERTAVVANGAPVTVSLPNGSSGITPSAATPFIGAAAPTASEGVDVHRGSTEIDSLLEHSLPVEGHLLAHSAPPTLNERARARDPPEAAPALSLTINPKKTENTAVAAAAPTDGACIATRDVEEPGGSTAPAPAKAAEAAEGAVRVCSKGVRVPGNKLLQQRRIKVKVRRRRSSSLAPAHQADATEDLSLENAPWPGEKRQDRAASLPRGHSQPAKPQELIGVPRPLLPPPPSPSSHAATEQQLISVDPLQRYSQGGATQQPWVLANWPCSAPAGRSAQKGKDGQSELWYASSSPVPLSHREFKSLLCSEYVSPKTTTVRRGSRAAVATAAADDAAELAASKAERELYEPYEHSGTNAAAPSGVDSSSGGGARQSSRLRSVHIQTEDEPPVLFSAAELGSGEGESPVRTPAGLSPPPPVAIKGDDEELVVEFPPPPHMMASDMPPPGDVGTDGEDSCCGCGHCECNCCSTVRAGCFDCWLATLRCLFPCCWEEPKAVRAAERQRPLIFQRPTSASAPPIRTAPVTRGVQP
ncbi:hypothetical protein LSCM4_05947 [Leishmania orientalis]|uniref:Uncharacterized protein n=1 Tax=Leishmania orientalis TaxID=2249476 RepID=A0A836KS29_9TRYP|nr:hypothetical protein LSCM4_05947 [Leishmania orientalis]